jgi:uncharacterized protein
MNSRPPPSSDRPFRVLALDGGGMRGLYTAEILDWLSRFFASEPVVAPDVGRAFDLIVGTSTGGILASALCAGASIKEVVDIYREQGRSIFKHSLPSSPATLGRFAATHLFEPVNDGEGLRTALTSVFGDMTVGEVYARRGIALCLQSTDMSLHFPVVIRSGHIPGDDRDSSTTLVDACMATAAAPILFPPARVTVAGEARVMADGSLWANSPIIPATSEALQLCGDRPIQVVSVGTCPPPMGNFAAREAKWGLFRWGFGFRIVQALMDAQINAAITQFNDLGAHLRVPVSLVRLSGDPQPAEYQRYISFDRADENAIDAISELAQRDADAIYCDAITPGSQNAVLRDIFSNLPEARSA